MNTTCELLRHDRSLRIVQYNERDAIEKRGYHWFDPTDELDIHFPEGIEAEVGECLYGLVMMIRPQLILETGTRLGLSTRYMALALRDLGCNGRLITIERDERCLLHAEKKIKAARLDEIVMPFCDDSRNIEATDYEIDMMFLDSKPEHRYEELLMFWQNLRPGGMVVVHDLWGFECKGFGPFPEELRAMLKKGEARAMNFPTSAGLTLIQKAYENDFQLGVMK